jgi:tetratricopeptide (TPR) repeat protein
METAVSNFLQSSTEQEAIIRDNKRRFPFHQHIENFVVVWLDTTFHVEQHKKVNISKNELRKITNEIHTFSTVDEAVEWITEISDEKVYLIISESIGETLVPVIYDVIQLAAIYIFYEDNKEIHNEWIKDYRIIKGFYQNISSLCEQLKEDIRKTEHDSIGFDITPIGSSLQMNDKQEISFMYAQLFKELILETNDDCKIELINFAREQYINNPHELNVISEFERTYQQSQAVQWYTRDTFLYRVINKALRIQEHLTLYAFRSFIRDLHMKLAHLQTESKPNNDKLILYRGQGLSYDEIDKLKSNRGGLLSMNTFLSTSEDKNIGEFYAQASVSNSHTEAVLFQINVNPMVTSRTPYATIDHLSTFQGVEKEYLFSMGTVFRIGSMEKMNNNIWHIKLTLTDANDKHLEELSTYKRRNFLVNQTGWEKFGKLMFQMGQYEKAKYFFGMSSSSWADRVHVLNSLGLIYAQTHRLDDALECFLECLKMKLERMPATDTSLAEIHLNIGLVYGEKGEVDRAVEHCQLALNMLSADKCDIVREINQERIAECYTNLGEYLRRQGKMKEALSYHEHALDIQRQYLPSNHLSIAMSYNNMIIILLQQGEMKKALELSGKALTIALASLPEDHPDMAVIYFNMAFCLRHNSRLNEALKHALKSLQILMNAFGSEHRRTKQVQNFVDIVRGEIAVLNMIQAFTNII